MFLEAPRLDLSIAKTEAERVLLTYADPGGAIKEAVVFHDGAASAGAGGDGWYRESWARCDLSEFGDDIAASYFGYQLWRDADGEPALTRDIVSFPGSDHCDWEQTTFLAFGEGTRHEVTYAAHPTPDIEDYLQGEFATDLPLPDNAAATPYSRDGRRLWLSPDKRYAYVGEPGSVEAWPRTKPGFGCG
jgi:hypothetical protein